MAEQPPTQKTALNLAEQLKQAWTYHNQHQNEQALPMFETLVNEEPTHIDANYGLGLTLAALGQKERAIAAFHRAAELVDVQVRQQAAEDEDSRYTMLARMIAQQLEVLNSPT